MYTLKHMSLMYNLNIYNRYKLNIYKNKETETKHKCTLPNKHTFPKWSPLEVRLKNQTIQP